MKPTEPEHPLDHPQVRSFAPGRFLAAYGLAIVCVTLAYVWVRERVWPVHELYGAISVLAGLTILALLTLWLELDGSPAQRWPTVTFVLYIPLFLLTVGLTAWMFATLYTRTMMPRLMPGRRASMIIRPRADPSRVRVTTETPFARVSDQGDAALFCDPQGQGAHPGNGGYGRDRHAHRLVHDLERESRGDAEQLQRLAAPAMAQRVPDYFVDRVVAPDVLTHDACLGTHQNRPMRGPGHVVQALVGLHARKPGVDPAYGQTL